jgi:hypothetical protein
LLVNDCECDQRLFQFFHLSPPPAIIS